MLRTAADRLPSLMNECIFPTRAVLPKYGGGDRMIEVALLETFTFRASRYFVVRSFSSLFTACSAAAGSSPKTPRPLRYELSVPLVMSLKSRPRLGQQTYLWHLCYSVDGQQEGTLTLEALLQKTACKLGLVCLVGSSCFFFSEKGC